MVQKFLPLTLIGVLVASLFSLTGCVGGPSFIEVHSSNEGYLIEEVLPHDTWFALSVSTLDINQQTFFHDFVARFTDDPNEFRNQILSGIDDNLATIDMSYIDDIQPILGEEGTRFMLALSEGNNGDAITHAGVTLQDPELAEQLFEDLEAEGRFVRKVVKDYDLYFNVYAEEQEQDVFYFAVYDDLFLIANDSDELAEMVDLAKSKGDYSLWSKDIYQAVTQELPTEHVGMMFMDGEYLAGRGSTDFAGMGISNNLAPYLAGQGMAFVADEDGLKMSGIALGNREKIDADDMSLDELQAKKRYLAEDMPGVNLGVYLESYDMARAIKQQMGDDEGAMLSAYMALLGLDPSTDISEFLSEGYAVALHENSGFLPGVTIMMDVSDGFESAEELIDNLDAQIAGLLGVFQLQGGTIAEAISKEEVEVLGRQFDQITLDLDSLMALYDTTGAFSLPDEVQGQTADLIYGVTDDHRLIISTYEGWVEEMHLMLDDTEVYEETLAHLKGYKEGVVYIDFDELTEFMSAFEAFREALRNDAELLSAEVATEAEEGTEGEIVSDVEVAEIDWDEFLEPLKSFAFSSNASKYEVELGGVVLLDEE